MNSHLLNKLISLLIIVLIFQSCSFTKRVYMPGYHVELSDRTNNNHKLGIFKKTENVASESFTGISDQDTIGFRDKDKYLTAEIQRIDFAGNSTNQTVKNNSKSFNPKVEQNRILQNSSENNKSSFKNKRKNIFNSTQTNEPDLREIEPFALVSFVLGIIGFFPLAIIFGFLSLRKIKKYPEKYKGKNFAIAGIILGFLILLYTGLIILYIFLVI